MPPVKQILDIVPHELHDALRDHSIRRFVGSVVAVVLERRGWAVARKGVRVPGADSPFGKGAVYERIASPPPPEEGNNLLDAMLAGLTAAQRNVLVVRVQALGV